MCVGPDALVTPGGAAAARRVPAPAVADPRVVSRAFPSSPNAAARDAARGRPARARAEPASGPRPVDRAAVPAPIPAIERPAAGRGACPRRAPGDPPRTAAAGHDARNPVRDLGADLLPRPRTLGASEKSKRPGGRLGASPPAIRIIAGTDARCQREGRREKNKNALAASVIPAPPPSPPRGKRPRGAEGDETSEKSSKSSQSSDGASSSSPRASKQRRATPSPRAGGGGARKKRASPELPAGRAALVAEAIGSPFAPRSSSSERCSPPPALDFASLLDILEGTTGDAMDATDSAVTNPRGVRDDESSEGSFLLSRERGGAAKKPRGDDARAISDDVDLGSPARSDATMDDVISGVVRDAFFAPPEFFANAEEGAPGRLRRCFEQRADAGEKKPPEEPPLLERSASQVSERGAFDLSAFENGCAHASAAPALARCSSLLSDEAPFRRHRRQPIDNPRRKSGDESSPPSKDLSASARAFSPAPKTRSGRLIRAPTFCEVARVPRERAALWAGPEMRLPSAGEVLRVLERARAAQDREGVRAARMERA